MMATTTSGALALAVNLIVVASASSHLRRSLHDSIDSASQVSSHVDRWNKTQSVPKEKEVLDGISDLWTIMSGSDEQTNRRSKEIRKVRHYRQFLEFDVLGDLTNVRECIVNAAVLCHALGLTLVLPPSYNSTYRSINLAEVYDLKRFKAGLAEIGVPVVWRRPSGVARYDVSIPMTFSKKKHRFQQVIDAFRLDIDRHQGESVSFYAPGDADDLNIGFHIFESRYVSACKQDMPICGHVQGALVHSKTIRQQASTIVGAMRAKSEHWAALHLHDFQPFLCNYSTGEELFIAAKLLKASKWKPGPLYLVSGRRDLKEAAASLEGWQLSNKWSLVDVSAFEFQHGAAVDFEVALHAPQYVGKRGSSFDTLAIELRLASGINSGHVMYIPQNPCAENLKREVANLAV